ncbi:hypothetical protein Tco_1118526 [Tanacetum coccineum]
MDTELVKGNETRTEGSSKRAEEELESDNSKKQKLDENVEAKVDDEAEMKKHMEIVDVQRIKNKAKKGLDRWQVRIRGTRYCSFGYEVVVWQWRLRGTVAARDPSQSLGSSRMVTCHLAIGGSRL